MRACRGAFFFEIDAQPFLPVSRKKRTGRVVFILLDSLRFFCIHPIAGEEGRTHVREKERRGAFYADTKNETGRNTERREREKFIVCFVNRHSYFSMFAKISSNRLFFLFFSSLFFCARISLAFQIRRSFCPFPRSLGFRSSAELEIFNQSYFLY